MSTDAVMPEGRWTFDGAVADAFDDMLARSIPQYEVMRQTVTGMACHFRTERSVITDLGCSRGEALAPLVDKYGAHNHFVGIEVSQPMLEAARVRFAGMMRAGVVEILNHDLRYGLPQSCYGSSVVLSVLTLQFTPIEHRQKILASIHEHLLPGGALILVEKALGNDAVIDDIMVSQYLDMKRRNGYSEDQIQRKRLSLEGVLVPVTARWNEELLRDTGFRHIDCFWRWMNFAGWVAVK
jgi:tRNA (cmo5U34)-methyltransferase